MRSFQIIFNPTSAAELAKMPKELQLQILGEFRGLPHQVMSTELEEFGKLERAGRILHRFRIGDYRVYFEKHELGVVVHRILSRHTLKDFLFLCDRVGSRSANGIDRQRYDSGSWIRI